MQRELVKIQRIVNRVQEMASAGEYETRQYLPGTLMTDLRADTVDARGVTVGDDVIRLSRSPDGGNARRTARAGTADGSSAPARPNGASVAAGTQAASPHTGPLAGLSILVVDDDLGICQSMAELLQCEGAETAFAVCAADALALIAAHPFDLVISDVVMPDMDGYDLYMELKERRPELPVILMTGYLYDRDHVIKRSKLAGLDGKVLFKKPIDPERLKRIILERCAKEDGHGRGRDARRNPPVP